MASVKAMTMKTRKGSYQPSALLIAIASGLACLAAAHKQTYEGYSLYRCQPQTSYQVERLRLLRDDKVSVNYEPHRSSDRLSQQHTLC